MSAGCLVNGEVYRRYYHLLRCGKNKRAGQTQHGPTYQMVSFWAKANSCGAQSNVCPQSPAGRSAPVAAAVAAKALQWPSGGGAAAAPPPGTHFRTLGGGGTSPQTDTHLTAIEQKKPPNGFFLKKPPTHNPPPRGLAPNCPCKTTRIRPSP